MYQIGNLFNSKYDAIVIPISVNGIIPEKYKRISIYNIPSSFKKMAIGEIQPITSLSKHIIFACVKDDYQNNRLSYSAIRNIGKEILKYSQKNNIWKISSPVLGADTDNIDPIISIEVFYTAFKEEETGNRQLTIYTDIKIGKDNRETFIKHAKSSLLALEYDLPQVLESETLKKILYDNEFYFKLAVEKYKEFVSYHVNDLQFYTQLEDKFETSELSYSKFLSQFQDTQKEYAFLTLCGELVAYIDYNAYLKNAWNKYPDKRVLAKSSVRQTVWIRNLIRFKINNHSFDSIEGPNIRNALLYLNDPAHRTTILSEKHRGLIFDTFTDYKYENDNSIERIHYLFEKYSIKCINPLNNLPLYTHIFYVYPINILWQGVKKEFTTLESNTLLEKDSLSLASELIYKNLKAKNKKLDLGKCGITDLSRLPELFECTHLETLILSNEWAEYQDGKWRERKSENKGKDNNLNNLPPEIKKLSNLRTLICGGDWNGNKERRSNAWTIDSTSPVAKLVKLEHLNLSNNNISSLRELYKLKKLKVIHLNNNNISLITPFRHLTELEEIYLSNNKIKSVSPLKGLKKIRTLDIHRNNIKDLSPLEDLINTLNLKNSKWEQDTINVAGNPLEKPSMDFVLLGKDAVMQYFKDIKLKGKYINKDIKVILVGNSEVGKTTMAKYLNNEKDLDKSHSSTHWLIEKVIKSKYEIDSIAEKCTIHLFDFGGHDYFHDTHHMFYSTNTIYILLWDKNSNKLEQIEKDQQNHKEEKVRVKICNYPLKYWLDSVKYHIKEVVAQNIETEIEQKDTYNSSLLLVQNKVSTTEDTYHLNNEYYHTEYPFIHEIIQVNILNEGRRNMKYFDSLMKEMLENLHIIGAQLPEFYGTIRESIKSYTGKPIINLAEFLQYCNSQPIKKINEEQASSLANYLKQIGIILLSQIDNKPNKIYIKKTWAIESIYKILDGLVEKKGMFDMAHITEKLDNSITAEDANNLIELMTDFKMIFRHPHFTPERYIAPLYLPHMPSNISNIFLSEHTIPYRRIEYSGFIQKHVILSFFQRYSNIILGNDLESQNKSYYHWKDGLIIKDPTTEQVVMIKFNMREKEENAFIDVFNLSRNENKETSFLQSIIQYLNEINEGYETDEMVTLDGVDYVSLGVLEKNAAEGKLIFTQQYLHPKNKLTNNSGKYFRLKDYQKFIKGAIRKQKIVISYSKKDLAYVHAFRRFLQPLVANNLIEQPWYCTMMSPADEWEEKIKSKFDEADIICFMVSDNFFTTNYITQYEIPRAIARYDNGERVKIVPIILTYIDWKRENPNNLQRFSGLPYQAKPVKNMNSDIAWYTIAESIKSMIEKDLDTGNDEVMSRELQEIYERLVQGELSSN